MTHKAETCSCILRSVAYYIVIPSEKIVVFLTACICEYTHNYINCIIAKLFYFCHLKKLVRPETFGPTLINRGNRTVMLTDTENMLIEISQLFHSRFLYL